MPEGGGLRNPFVGAMMMDPMLGRAIGNYIITGELARGGMGIVYRARHVTLPRDVVVKCLRPLAFSDDAQNDLRARFRREAHIQSQLDHPHIVRVYEFYAQAEEYFLVMEYVPCVTLRSMLDERGVLPAAEVSALAVQALDGLAYAHGLHYVDELGNNGIGIIHRDIKPANLLADKNGNLKVTDFGIVKALGTEPGEGQFTKTGFSLGTVEYMSPEQIRNLTVDARSDLYSLGVTLYEMLSGRVPFQRTAPNSDYDVLCAHIETEPPPIRTLNPGVPPALAEVVARSLKKDPDQRWQTAAEFREALISTQQDRAVIPSTAVRPAPDEVKSRSAPDVRRRQFMAAGVAALAVVVVGTVASELWLGGGGKNSQPAQSKPTIAVLPFADESPEKNQEYFSDGLADELLNDLAKTPGLRVTGRTSSFQFKGKTADSRVIGEKLRVAAILEGSVRVQSNRARIAVQLIQAVDGIQLWSQIYDRRMNDIFAVQEEIARAVTGALKVTLLGEKTAGSAKSTNAKAYNAYLQGRYFLLGTRNKRNLEQAASYFEQAIQQDPGYAPAWVGLGESRVRQADSDYIPEEEGYRNAREAVEHALVLDADLAEAHAVMGWIEQNHDWAWAEADASYKRALALEPGNTVAIRGAASLAWILGHLDEAIALYRRAIEIEPLQPRFYDDAGLVLNCAGRQEEAAAAVKKAIELSPEMETAHGLLARIYLTQMRPQEALAEAEKEKHHVFHPWALALAYHALGSKKESDANLAELIAKFQDNPYQIAEVYAFRGEKDRAFEWLEKAYAAHDLGLTELRGDPLLKSLERDPRYPALLQKMHLPL